MDREAWHAAVHGVAKSWIRLSDWTELTENHKYSTFSIISNYWALCFNVISFNQSNQELWQEQQIQNDSIVIVHFLMHFTWVGCYAVFQGIFPTQGLNPGLPHLLSEPSGKPKYTGVSSPIPSPGDLPDPGIEQGSPALQEDSLPAEVPGKP